MAVLVVRVTCTRHRMGAQAVAMLHSSKAAKELHDMQMQCYYVETEFGAVKEVPAALLVPLWHKQQQQQASPAALRPLPRQVMMTQHTSCCAHYQPCKQIKHFICAPVVQHASLMRIPNPMSAPPMVLSAARPSSLVGQC